jgi:hypothetical protein
VGPTAGRSQGAPAEDAKVTSKVFISLRVPVDPTRAFEAFTREISSWWRPDHLFQITPHGDGQLAFEPGARGRLIAHLNNGETFEIGRIRSGNQASASSSAGDAPASRPGSRRRWKYASNRWVTRRGSRSNTERGTRSHNGMLRDTGSPSTSPCNGWPIGGVARSPRSAQRSERKYQELDAC